MAKIIVQIYEVQDPAEADQLISAGVDHIGSVILSENKWQISKIKKTINLISESSAKSSLIPLFSDLDAVSRVLDYYQPDMVHFCEDLMDMDQNMDVGKKYAGLQQRVKERFPEIKIIRSIPIPASGVAIKFPVLELAGLFEPFSDYFLTDTLLTDGAGALSKQQPVEGFVGITGKTCDWNIASQLVGKSRIPVILAGGISPWNVTEGIMQVRPAGIDSCTGTNALGEKGTPVRFKKDMTKVKQLVNAVRNCEPGT